VEEEKRREEKRRPEHKIWQNDQNSPVFQEYFFQIARFL
jgi:hypothetical protein